MGEGSYFFFLVFMGVLVGEILDMSYSLVIMLALFFLTLITFPFSFF